MRACWSRLLLTSFMSLILLIIISGQNQMLKALRWPFKSFTNFSISSLGFTALAFYGYTIYSEGNFNQPIVGESIKILGKHPQIKALVGYPLSYSFSISNRFVQKEAQSYYSFNVSGPKSTTNVEMTTGKVEAGQIYSYGGKNQKIAEIQKKMEDQQTKIKALEVQYAASKKRQRRKQITLEKTVLANKIKQMQDQLVEAKYEIIEKRNRYFVPQKQLYTKANDPRSKGSEEVIATNQILTGIHDLVITLPNRTKMIVYPQAKKKLEQKRKIVESYNSPDPPTLGSLNKKIVLDISDLSKQQIMEYGKQKTNFMYTKYGSYRIISMVLFAAGFWGLIMYKKKNVLRSFKGSILQHEVKTQLALNSSLTQILRSKGRKSLQFDQVVGGGMVNNNFNCVIYIKNLTNGKVEFQGKYIEDINIYQYTKMLLKYNDKETKRQIDLLEK